MPYDSGGNYSPPSPPIFPAVAGTVVQSGYFNATITDLGSALTLVAGRVTQLATGPFTGYVGITPLSEVQTASAGQTVFPLTTFAYSYGLPGAISVYVDGFKLPASDITQTSSTSVTLATALLGSEQVEFTTGNFSSVMSGSSRAQNTVTTPVTGPSYEFRRNAEYAGGSPGSVNSAVRVVSYVDNAAATTFEWALLVEMHNSATAGENVGGYLQGTKNAGAGPTWASVIEVIDLGAADPTSGAVGLELDVRGNGTDANNNRIGLDIVVSRQNLVGAAMEAAYGMRFQTAGDAFTTYKTLIGTAVGIHVGLGIDLSGATIAGAAIKLSNAQAIQFDTSTLQSTSGNGLDHNVSGVFKNRMLATGGYQVGGAQVIGPRVNGWALPTGTLSRTTFDQSTVTLPVLAQHVAALITDLYGAGSGHGLIGA